MVGSRVRITDASRRRTIVPPCYCLMGTLQDISKFFSSGRARSIYKEPKRRSSLRSLKLQMYLSAFLFLFGSVGLVLHVALSGSDLQMSNPLVDSVLSDQKKLGVSFQRSQLGAQGWLDQVYYRKLASTLTSRQKFEEKYPSFEKDRIKTLLDPLRVPQSSPPPQQPPPYDILNCPDEPPAEYPYEWNALDVLDHWSIDTTEIPKDYIHQGLCVFEWPVDQQKIETYRQEEVPFVMRNHNQVLQTAERWMTPGYLEELVGPKPQRNEHSHTNHFMFWRETVLTGRLDKLSSWKAPTDMVQLTYREWLERAIDLESKTPATLEEDVNRERWYFRLNGNRYNNVNTYLYEELPMFIGDLNPTLFMVDPEAERGINCRFGMKGIFAEMHFDPSRNWILVMGGQRRYLLAHPRECPNVQLFPFNHPSGRHSAINWSRPRQHMQEEPRLAGFSKAHLNEVVMQAGDALYLPTSWFHAIVSLNKSYQCNARSGKTDDFDTILGSCGFPSTTNRRPFTGNQRGRRRHGR